MAAATRDLSISIEGCSDNAEEALGEQVVRVRDEKEKREWAWWLNSCEGELDGAHPIFTRKNLVRLLCKTIRANPFARGACTGLVKSAGQDAPFRWVAEPKEKGSPIAVTFEVSAFVPGESIRVTDTITIKLCETPWIQH